MQVLFTFLIISLESVKTRLKVGVKSLRDSVIFQAAGSGSLGWKGAKLREQIFL
jgi:hypothetical protein